MESTSIITGIQSPDNTGVLSTIEGYFNVFYESSHGDVVIHDKMCILNLTFKKILNMNLEILQAAFPKYIQNPLQIVSEIESLFHDIKAKDWELGFNEMLKFLESREYIKLSELKSELLELDNIIDDDYDDDEMDDEMEDDDECDDDKLSE